MNEMREQFEGLVRAANPVHPRLVEDAEARARDGRRPRGLPLAALAATTVVVLVAAVALLASMGGRLPAVETPRPATVVTPEPPVAVATGDVDECAELGGPVRDEPNLIKLGGVTYAATVNYIEFNDLGPVYGTVERGVDWSPLAGGVDSPEALDDGDATLLPVGTRVYSAAGYNPRFRLVAGACERLYVYHAVSSLRAERGEDLFGIRGRVRWIEVARLAGNGWATSKGIINDPARVEAIVGALLAAPVRERSGATGEPSSYPQYRITFALSDGTDVQALYLPRSGAVVPYPFGWTVVEAPGELRDAVDEVLPE
jgi:hypothetical protein